MTILSAVGDRALRLAALRRATLAAGAVRGHGLVLVFHRITPEDARPGLLPSVPQPLFRRMLDAILDAGDIVPLESLLVRPASSRRPRFALTFDDDWWTHHDQALPVLAGLQLPATFFLTGRSLLGLGPLWFERLDALVTAHGVEEVARRLDVSADGAEDLAAACERDRALQARIECMADGEVRRVGPREVRALAQAGMTIGSHTLQHRPCPALDNAALAEALTAGRAELAEAAGCPVRLFAYPHGRGDHRAAAYLERAGFIAAFTGRPRPVRPGDNPYLLGRWEPGPMSIDRFVARLGVRLNGWERRAS